jgi:hypothetical protein
MEAFHVPRWHVDDQAGDLPGVDRLHVFADEVDVPVVDVLGARLDDRPRLPDEFGKVALCFFPLDLRQCAGGVNRPERR